MRYDSKRVTEILFQDPTRQLQLLCAFSAWVRAAFTLVYNPEHTNPQLAAAFFYYFPWWVWTLAMTLVGIAQWWAAGTIRWWVKYRVAALQAGLTVYGIVCILRQGQATRGNLPLYIVLLVAELLIALRALHDRELNGTDRRIPPSE